MRQTAMPERSPPRAAGTGWLRVVPAVAALMASSPAIAQSCGSVDWGYSIAQAVDNLSGIAPPYDADDQDLLHRAEVNIEQVINHYGLVTELPPVCWRCNPILPANGPGTASALSAAEALSAASDLINPGLPEGQHSSLLDTIKGWADAPACTPAQIAAADGAAGIEVKALDCEMIPGTWSWFVNGDVTFSEDGTLTQGDLTGMWTCENDTRHIIIVWSHGFTDEMILSEDGTKMTGTNNTGNLVSGEKKTAAAGDATNSLWWFIICGGDRMRTPTGPPEGKRWLGNYATPDGTSSWKFDLQESGDAWAGTGVRADEPTHEYACHARLQPDA